MPKVKKSQDKLIIIKGARVNNLKNISLSIPCNNLIVITGISGSGKSSLAFDTLFAEGQRRYVESLSSYARQFLGKISKPDVDDIAGIPPAIAIEQKVNTRNPRSTVGTSTEIYDYIKLLFARIGKIISPFSGKQVKKQTVSDVLDFISSLKQDTKILILSPVKSLSYEDLSQKIKKLQDLGFSRYFFKNKIIEYQDIAELSKNDAFNNVQVVVDRTKIKDFDKNKSRYNESISLAFNLSNGYCNIFDIDNVVITEFSDKLEENGVVFIEPSEHIFSFNSPLGACPKCEGFGKIIGIDEKLVIPNKSLSVFEDAIVCWRGEKMRFFKEQLIYNADKFDFPIHRPINELSKEQYKLLWTGNEYFEGINKFFKMLESENYKIQNRVMLARYKGKTTCDLCGGSRLRKEALYIKVGGKSIDEIVNISIDNLIDFFDNISLDQRDKKIAERILIEIKNRLHFLNDVGLGYLTLNRLSSTLSGGESQRVNLATSLGSSLVGSLYILDEPSIGLHSRDTKLLIKVLKQLRDLGNTVIIVEHDEEIMTSSDYIIDIGPYAGENGGEIVFFDETKKLLKAKTLTADFLSGKQKIEIPDKVRKWKNKIIIRGASENNLKNIDVNIPLNIFTVVTGVSGSGKSSLIKNILYPVLSRKFGGYGNYIGSYVDVSGDINSLSNVEFVDQNPIGKSSRSNPVTYIKAYDDIRKLFSETHLAKYNNFKPAHFSFNVDGGRCDECQGEGIIKIEMQFMADVRLVCESCKGKRFKEEILEIEYNGKNIYDVLEMTVNQAIGFFSVKNGRIEKKIIEKLMLLKKVGLDYVKLGQASNTLSGGESQRIKLASFLGKEKEKPTLFIFDEPTTGLHFYDIKKLLKAFNELIFRGHSVLVIEHNLDVIKTADWIIDLGPEGGNNGGKVVFEGTPREIINEKKSYTGKFLKSKFE